MLYKHYIATVCLDYLAFSEAIILVDYLGLFALQSWYKNVSNASDMRCNLLL